MFTQIVIYSGIVLVAYLIGSIPFGYLIGKLYGHNLLKEGSCNIGATNVTRVVGNIPGKICFALDFIKGAIPVIMVVWAVKSGQLHPSYQFGAVVAAISAVLGHMFSVFLHFRGGKGVSTAAGAVVGLSPYAVVIALIIWAAVFFTTRYVSLASIIAAIAVPAIAWLLSYTGVWPLDNVALIFLALLSILAVARHHQNIKRLLNGTENRFKSKK